VNVSRTSLRLKLDYSFEMSFVRVINIAALLVRELVVYLLVNYECFELS